MRSFPRAFFRNRWFFLLLTLLVATAGLWMWKGGVFRAKENPELATPVLALKALQGKSIYFNGPAAPWLASKRPELLTAEDKDPASARFRGFVQAVQNPKLFRQLDRQYRFDALLFVGDSSQYRPLLEHLLESKDWTVDYLDHTSLIFRRDVAEPWSVRKLDPLRARFAGASAAERAAFLSQVAGKMISVREIGPAKALLEEAQRLDGDSAEVWGTWAQYRMAQGLWKEAITAADRALKADDEWLPAIACKAQALYSMKYFADAYRYSTKLVKKNDSDPGLLFYHAKIAHEARAFDDEVATLRKLITLAEEQERPTSGYRVYLAQAYASKGDAEPALAEFAKAIADPELPKEQRKFAQETSAQIRSRIGK